MRHSRIGLVLALVAPLLFAPLQAAGQALSAQEVMGWVGFSSDDMQKVIGGGIVDTNIPSSNDLEIAAAMAFLIRVPPEHLLDDVRAGLVNDVDPHNLADGELSGTGSLAQLAKLPVPADAVQAYLAAAPGDALNLSTAEIQQFQALSGPGAVPDAVRSQLLARYQAYHAKGLGGIAPYARSDGKSTDAAALLRKASEAGTHLKARAPEFYRVLLGYPNDLPAGFLERFYWSRYEAHGTPIYLLTHSFSVREGDVLVVCQRQFYASASYDVEQAVAGFFPVNEGTLVIYANRTATEQVAGFGGSAKRSLGARVMADQLSALFQKVGAKAQGGASGSQ